MSSKAILTSILTELNGIEGVTPLTGGIAHHSILSTLQGEALARAKSSLLTLHFLFPYELLLALDIIDRRLVSAVRYEGSEPDSEPVVYYVQSASAVTGPNNRKTANSRFRNAWMPAKAHYEVRLDSWNCSCPAFAQSQLKLLMRSLKLDKQTSENRANEQIRDKPSASFGGTTTKEDASIPICKHILATIMCAITPALFGSGCKYTSLSREELAAWSAGFGDT